MTPEQEKINRWLKKNPWKNPTLFNRPHWTRRNFFQLAGSGVTLAPGFSGSAALKRPPSSLARSGLVSVISGSGAAATSGFSGSGASSTSCLARIAFQSSAGSFVSIAGVQMNSHPPVITLHACFNASGSP